MLAINNVTNFHENPQSFRFNTFADDNSVSFISGYVKDTETGECIKGNLSERIKMLLETQTIENSFIVDKLISYL